jgi:hypothetical protein
MLYPCTLYICYKHILDRARSELRTNATEFICCPFYGEPYKCVGIYTNEESLVGYGYTTEEHIYVLCVANDRKKPTYVLCTLFLA